MLSKNMTTFWGNFAHHGNPNPTNEPDLWPLYDTKSTQRIVLNTGDASYLSQYHAQQSEFWKLYYEKYYPSPASISFPFVSLEPLET